MSCYYKVNQGDHLVGIANRFGFSDYTKIWNHPGNAELKADRLNPNVLYPGDSLFIPDFELGEKNCCTEKKHHFVLNRAELKLRLVLEDLYEEPIGNASCLLASGTNSYNLVTDISGCLEQIISPDAHEASLIIQGGSTPLPETRLLLKIGNLDPPDKISGQVARLNNLGYSAGNIEPIGPKDFQSAIEEFQCDQGLSVDGICGPKTQKRLKDVHGS